MIHILFHICSAAVLLFFMIAAVGGVNKFEDNTQLDRTLLVIVGGFIGALLTLMLAF